MIVFSHKAQPKNILDCQLGATAFPEKIGVLISILDSFILQSFMERESEFLFVVNTRFSVGIPKRIFEALNPQRATEGKRNHMMETNRFLLLLGLFL